MCSEFADFVELVVDELVELPDPPPHALNPKSTATASNA
jgi:hypothetical protein